jgi:hypothetical protein
MPKPSPIYVNGIQNISPLIQMLEQNEITALADNRVQVLPKTSECYGIIVKAVAENYTYKLKERNYKVVLKKFAPVDIKTRNSDTQLQTSGTLNDVEPSYPSQCSFRPEPSHK